MTRNRKSSKTDEEKVSLRSDGLRHPYPKKPGLGKYVIYCDTHKEGEDHPRVLVMIFAEAYAAARLVKILVGEDDYKDHNVGGRTGIITDSGIIITAFPEGMIKELAKFKPTEAEAAWRDDSVEQSALRLKHGKQWEVPKREREVETETVEDETTGELVTRKVSKKARKEKKEKAPKIDRTGMVTATALAARLKIEPRIFRGALRAMKKVKPTGGWLWSPEDAEAIFKEVTAHLEGEEKGKSKDKKKKDKKEKKGKKK